MKAPGGLAAFSVETIFLSLSGTITSRRRVALFGFPRLDRSCRPRHLSAAESTRQYGLRAEVGPVLDNVGWVRFLLSLVKPVRRLVALVMIALIILAPGGHVAAQSQQDAARDSCTAVTASQRTDNTCTVAAIFGPCTSFAITEETERNCSASRWTFQAGVYGDCSRRSVAEPFSSALTIGQRFFALSTTLIDLGVRLQI